MTVRFELFVNDINKSIAFYRDILGFVELPNYGNYHPLQNGEVVIGIGLGKLLPERHYFRPEVVGNARKGVGIEIVLEVDDIEKLYKKIQKTNYTVAEGLKKQEWGLSDFRLIDPDGYYLRLTSK